MQSSQMRDYWQAITHATRPEQYKECLAGNGCSEAAVRGHLIPRAYMKRLPGSGAQLVVFNTYRFSMDPILPMEKGIGVVPTGYFTCRDHDAIFQPADQVTNVHRLWDTRVLNLICYRGVLHARWWQELWARAAETMDLEFGRKTFEGSPELLRSMSEKIRSAQERLEPCTLAGGQHTCSAVQCHEYQHLVWVSEGPPVLAAAQFGINESATGDLGLWGFTLIPGTDGNAFCLHFPKEAGTGPLDIALGAGAGKAELSGRDVTRILLKMCQDIVFSQTSWKAVGEAERRVVLQAVDPAQPNPEFDIDLFNGTPWRVL